VLVGNNQARSRSWRLVTPAVRSASGSRIHAASRAREGSAARLRRDKEQPSKGSPARMQAPARMQCTRACTGRPGRREGEFSVSRSIWDKVRRFRARRDTESRSRAALSLRPFCHSRSHSQIVTQATRRFAARRRRRRDFSRSTVDRKENVGGRCADCAGSRNSIHPRVSFRECINLLD